MASPSTVRPALAFGMEIELMVKPTGHLGPFLTAHGWNPKVTVETENDELKDNNRKALRRAIAEALTLGGIKAGLMPQDYRDWTVTDDGSLIEFAGYCK